MHTTSLKTAALLGALATVEARPSQNRRDIITALPENASDLELRFQPWLDFDTDGCYNTAAVDPSGYTNPGHDATGTPQGDCRDPHQLENSNVYSRSRCNNGFCAIMYEYYFEKDQANPASFLSGHRHDWENIVVFTKDDAVVRVSPSCHAKYSHATDSPPLGDGTHPQIVYHKDGTFTHCFRIANDDDISGPENYTGEFYRSPLVGWNGWPNDGVWQALVDAWPSGVCPKWLDSEFENALRNAMGDSVSGFDPSYDE
ncbi:hypothetical protein ACO1O0_005892 [Amphichorda felina]